jgi:hypothetical protein
MPTIAETIRLHASSFIPRDASSWRIVAACVLFLLAIMLVLPPLRTFERPPIAAIGGVIGAALGTAHREHRYGGSPALILAAAMTAFAIGTVVLAALVVVWWQIGGLLESFSPFVWLFSQPVESAVGVLIALMGLIIAVYVLTRSRRQRANDEFEDAVRAERIRRGLPTAP